VGPQQALEGFVVALSRQRDQPLFVIQRLIQRHEPAIGAITLTRMEDG
jgi:hypothetical protein